ncbi:MAG: UDP-N-acetylmuramate--L-alanine ligase [Lacisediminihabitans sp.]
MIKSDFAESMPDKPGTVHFVGIGGAGMSGIARLFVAAGFTVTGSDIRLTGTVAALRDEGVVIFIGHDAAHIQGAGTLVVTGAIAEDNPEFLAAKSEGIPVIHRARALAWLTRGHRLVSVAGAHGKTTSTAMVVTALLALGEDPSFVNGGVISSLGVSAASGDGELFIVEADESDGSFLLYDSAIALITNVDPDHLDHYGSEDAFEDAFVAFARKASERVVISSDDPRSVDLLSRLGDQDVTTFGLSETANIRLHSLVSEATIAFALRYRGVDYRTTLRVAGVHNAINAAGAFGVLVALGIDPQRALDAIATFEGTERRFELRGEVSGVKVYDDFAHHPTEIRAALSGARDVVGAGRLIVVFQPHLFSRTRMLSAEFAAAFELLADHTIVVPIYGARQEPEPGVTGELITEHFRDKTMARYCEDWGQAAKYAAATARPGDFIVTMGGGDIYKIVPQVIGALERSPRHPEA